MKMKKILLYGTAIASYMIISKKLKDKESSLSKCLKKYAEKLSCMINKMTESVDAVKEGKENLNKNEEEKEGSSIFQKQE